MAHAFGESTHVDADGHTNAFAPLDATSTGVDTGAAELKAADLAKARAAGWTETVAFDYDEFQRQGGDDWLGNAKVYEWNEEYGDVAPGHPELERQLYGLEHRVTAGNHRGVLDDIEVVLEGPTRVAPIQQVRKCSLVT